MTKFLQQRSYLFIASLVFWATAAFAQVPVNDECINALDINTLAPGGAYYNYCSLPSEFTSVNATAGVYTAVPAFVQPLCFGGATGRDVWFKFTTDNTNLDVTLTIRGGTLGSGLLHQPQIALYREGTFGCPADGNDLDLECVRSAAGASNLAKDLLGLDPLTVYYIRVNDYSASATPNAGTFQLCLKTYIPRTILDGNNPPTVNACTGTLVDDGNFGNYSNSTNETVTITAPSSGCMLFVLDSLDIRGNATFTVFNGLTPASPTLAALTSTNNSNNPRQYIATAGSVTIRFVANLSGAVGAGFVGHWECAPDCAALQPCSAIIYDPQGPTGNYLPNQTVTNTYCPNAPGRRMQIDFHNIDVTDSDNFTVYDGPDATFPSFGPVNNALFSGAGADYTAIASIGNTSGCLTIVFTSNGATEGTGYDAQLQCNKPCQTIVPSLLLPSAIPTYPSIVGDSAIHVCLGQNVTISASATYPQNNTLYPQNDNTSLYYFNWGDGGICGIVNPIQGPAPHTASHVYTTPGIYRVRVVVADSDSLCGVQAPQFMRVRVIGKPQYQTTTPVPICLGQNVTLSSASTGSVSVLLPPVAINSVPAASTSGTLCVPDYPGGVLTPFVSPVNVQNLNALTLNNTFHIRAVYAKFQHTYMGDLDIKLRCPNNSNIILKQYGTGTGGGNFFGIANDGASTCTEEAQGLIYGWNGLNTTTVTPLIFPNCAASTTQPDLTYSPTGLANPVWIPYTLQYFPFSMNAAAAGAGLSPSGVFTAGPNTVAPANGFANPYPFSSTASVVTPGFFNSFDPMANLNGCPVNGTWSLEFTDHLGADNGIIYEWGIVFDAAAYPNLENYSAVIQSSGFLCNPTITNPANCSPVGSIINQSTVVATPTTVGTIPYAYQAVMQGFPACTYFDTLVNVTVLAVPVTPTLPDQSACLGQPVNLNMGPVCTNVTPLTVSGGPGITIATGAAANASPFPAALNVALTGDCNYVVESVTVNGILHGFPADIDMWLVSPTGQAVILMSDCGNGADFLAGTNLTYKMGAPAMTTTTPGTGTYAPTNIDVTTDAGVPAGATTNLSTLTGTPAQMSGNWGLYIRDDFNGNGGSVQNWSITFSTPPPPYATQWSNGPTTPAITVTCAAAGTSTYTVTATGANGCTTTQDAIVTCGTLAAPIVSCDNTTAGCVTYTWPTVVATPAVTAYEISVGGAAFTSIGNVTTYQVCGLGQNQTVNFQVQAVGSCTSLPASSVCTTQVSCGVTETHNPSSCGLALGNITLTPTGTAPFTTVWTTTATAIANNTLAPTNLAGGVYTAVVTDANNCTATTTVTIGDTTPLPAPVVNCANQGVSSIDIQWAAVAGATAYEVNVAGAGWTNIGNVLTYTNNGMVVNSCVTIEVRAVGGTCINGIGSRNCCAVGCVLTAALAGSTTTCGGADGTVTATSTNSVAPLAYALSGGNVTGATTGAFTGLAAGTYTVTITDGSGCTATATTTVVGSTGIAASITNITQPSCNLSNGAFDATVTGGQTPYSYAWNPNTLPTNANQTGLAAGTYTVTATDALGCSSVTSVVLNASPALTVNLTAVQQPTCGQNNAGVTATATGGNGVYSYIWTGGQTTALIGNQANGSTHTVTVSCPSIPGCTATAFIVFNSNNPLAAVVTPTNVTCNGLVNGSANVNVLNGNGGYTFLWSANAANQTTNPATGLAATVTGTVYTVIITDAQTCSITRTVTITQPAVLAVTVNTTSIVQPSCFGGSNGGATATSTGGSPFYTYAWDMGTVGAAPNTVTGLNAGTHTVTVTDLNGCTSSTTFVVGQPTQIMTTAIPTTNVACNGGSNGALTAVANSATAPYTYTLSNATNTTGATTGVFTGLAAGTYTVTATDANGCSTTASATITQPTPIVLSLTSTLTSCFGGTDGTATVMASGGNNVFTYLWSAPPVNTAATATGLSAGTHTVTVTDGNGCAASATVLVGSPTAVTATIAPNPINPTCTAGGSAMVTGAGGTPNYTYAWTGGSTAQMPTNLTAGVQTVTVTDSKGCTATANVTLTSPSTFTASITPQQPSCGLNNGSVAATPSGNYTYMWNGGVPTQTRTNIGAGFYVVTVTDVATQCTATASQTLTASTAPSAAITVTQPTCITPAALCTAVTNGLPTYTYLWDNGEMTACIAPTATGSHTVTVTDAAGCTATRSASITMPATFTATIASTNAACNGNTGTITTAITASSGGGISYVWTGGLPAQANHTGVPEGVYTVVMTDLGTQCVQTLTTTVTEPNVLGSWANSGVVSCFGLTDGQINFPAYGGTTPYSFAIPGATNGTGIFTGLPSGNYACTITDANGCIANATTYVGSPGAVAAYATSGTVTCFGNTNGQISVSAVSGTAPYTYTLGAVSNTTGVFAGLSSGNYTVSVADANNCPTTATTYVGSPGAVAAYATSGVVTCFGSSNGQITVSAASGAGAPYTYSLTGYPNNTTGVFAGLPSGNYTVSVADANGCPGTVSTYVGSPGAIAVYATSGVVTCFGNSNGQITVSAASGAGAPYTYSLTGYPNNTTGVFAGLTEGIYTVNVTDASGCTGATASTYVGSPGPVAVYATPGAVTCFGNTDGQISFSAASGAGGPYTYTLGAASNTTGLFTGLTEGIYTVNVTDASGCTGATASTYVGSPGPVAVYATPGTVTCFGNTDGQISFSAASGAGAPYTYTLGAASNTTGIFAGLSSSTYTVSVTDVNGCTGATASTWVGSPGALEAYATNGAVDCFGGTNGQISVSAASGTSPYTFAVNATTSNSTGLFTNLGSADYAVTVTDAKGCTTIASTWVGSPGEIVAYATPGMVSCLVGNNSSNGAISVNVSSGTGPYTYTFAGATGTSNTFNGLAAGTYTVTITDSKLCSTTISTYVGAPGPYIVDITPSATTITVGAEGTLIATAGGTNYAWTPQGNAQQITIKPLVETTYTVTVTSTQNCTATASITIQVRQTGITMPNFFTPNGDGRNDMFFPYTQDPTIQFTTFKIYNRWGDLVHNSTSPWDGTYNGSEQPMETYVYVIQYTLNGVTETKNGSFMLIR